MVAPVAHPTNPLHFHHSAWSKLKPLSSTKNCSCKLSQGALRWKVAEQKSLQTSTLTILNYLDTKKYHMRVISVKEDIRQQCLGIWFRIVRNLVVHTEIVPKQPWACQLLIPELSLRQTCTSQLQSDHVNKQRLKEINLIEIEKAYLLLEKVVPHGATFYFRHGKKDSNNRNLRRKPMDVAFDIALLALRARPQGVANEWLVLLDTWITETRENLE